LKGHGFSRADFEAQNASALAAEGCIFTFLNLPSGAKAQDFQELPCGTAKAVPFQNMNLLNNQFHAIVLRTRPTPHNPSCPPVN
jgi:hypothetical protein